MKLISNLKNVVRLLPMVALIIGTVACSDDHEEPLADNWHSLTLTASDGGSVSSVQNEYAEGEEVTVTATPDDGYYFSGWYEDNQSISTDPVYTFPMPSRDVALQAAFSEIPTDPVTTDYPAAAGGHFTILINEGGGLMAFGLNDHGQLGDGTTESRTTPVTIMPTVQFSNVFCGASSTYAIDRNGNLYAWGNNENGRLGDGTTIDRLSPVVIMSGTRFTRVSAGSEHVLALDSEGGLWTFGANDHGQLGDGTTSERPTPVRIMDGTEFIDINAGAYFSFAIDADHRLWAFGWNNHGQLGDGTTTEQHAPVQVMDERRFNRIAAGNYHTLAIDFNGKLWGFGMNMNGQLGDASREDKLTATAILSERTFTRISARGTHSLALDTDGGLWAFGGNAYGQLGDGTNTNKTTPVQTASGMQLTGIYTGWYHTVATDTDGHIWLWGSNQDGELGDGTTSNHNSPVAFGSGNPDTGGSNYLVVYYTWSGNSRSLANDIAGILNCDAVQVEVTTPYNATTDQELYPIAQAEIAAIDNNGTYPSISTTVENMNSYDAIVVVYPLWYSRMATPMQSFLHNHSSSLAGKTIALVCTSASSGISGTVDDARRLCPDSTLPEALWVRSSAVGNSHASIVAWLENIGLSSGNI